MKSFVGPFGFLLCIVILNGIIKPTNVEAQDVKVVFSLNILERVTYYGQTAKLFCDVGPKFKTPVGFWDIFIPEPTLAFAVVKNEIRRNDTKYSGQFVENGFTLEIRNLSKDDLNISYKCSVDNNVSVPLLLLEADVFSGNLHLVVKKKISKYGETLKLVCVTESCNNETCQWKFGWRRYLYGVEYVIERFDWRNMGANSKYTSHLVNDGFTLEIGNVSNTDLNINYECYLPFNKSECLNLTDAVVFEDILISSDDNEKGSGSSVIVAITTGLLVFAICLLVVLKVRKHRHTPDPNKQNGKNTKASDGPGEQALLLGNVSEFGKRDDTIDRSILIDSQHPRAAKDGEAHASECIVGTKSTITTDPRDCGDEKEKIATIEEPKELNFQSVIGSEDGKAYASECIGDATSKITPNSRDLEDDQRQNNTENHQSLEHIPQHDDGVDTLSGGVNTRHKRTRFEQQSLVVVGVCNEMIRDLIYHIIKPDDLYQRLKDNDLDLNQKELKLFANLSSDGYEKCETGLIFKLLVLSQCIPAPGDGWGSSPKYESKTLSDDVLRIKRARDAFHYRTRTDVTEEELEIFFTTIKSVAERFDKILRKEQKDSFKKKIELIEHQQLEFNEEDTYIKKVKVVEIIKCVPTKYVGQKRINIFISSIIDDIEVKPDTAKMFGVLLDITKGDIQRMLVDSINENRHDLNKTNSKLEIVKAQIGSVLITIKVLKTAMYSEEDLINEVFELIKVITERAAIDELQMIDAIISKDLVFGDIADQNYSFGKEKEESTYVHSNDAVETDLNETIKFNETQQNQQEKNLTSETSADDQKQCEREIHQLIGHILHNKDVTATQEYSMNRKRGMTRYAKQSKIVIDIFHEMMKNLLNHLIKPNIINHIAKNMIDDMQIPVRYIRRRRTPKPSVYPEYVNLDTKDIREIIVQLHCLPSPSKGWNTTPEDGSTALEDDIQRIWCARNSLIRHPSAYITQQEHDSFWKTFIAVAERFDNALQNKSNISFKKSIEKIKSCELETSEVESYVQKGMKVDPKKLFGSIHTCGGMVCNLFTGPTFESTVERYHCESYIQEDCSFVLFLTTPTEEIGNTLFVLIRRIQESINKDNRLIKITKVERDNMTINIHPFILQRVYDTKKEVFKVLKAIMEKADHSVLPKVDAVLSGDCEIPSLKQEKKSWFDNFDEKDGDLELTTRIHKSIYSSEDHLCECIHTIATETIITEGSTKKLDIIAIESLKDSGAQTKTHTDAQFPVHNFPTRLLLKQNIVPI